MVRTNPPTEADFMSAAARGRPSPGYPETARLWDGISMYRTLAQARRRARTAPSLGSFIAEVTIPTESPARVERTLGPGHFTVWAAPANLLGWVVSVVPAQEAPVE